jgi:non-lysosomal glucosylceramidase
MLKKLGSQLLAFIIILFISLPIFSATTIPTQAWSRDINAGGYYDGAPIGGFGAGTVTWRLNGNFYKTRLNIGAGSDDGTAFTDDTNCKFFLYQKPASGSATTLQLDSSLGTGQATYYSLFPKSWVNYSGSKFTVKAVVTQFSPIIPNDLTRTSYPVGIYEWDISNPTAGSVDAAIMMTWDNTDFSGAGTQYNTSGNMSGLVLRSGVANPPNCNQGEFCVATNGGAGVTVSYMAATLANLQSNFSTAGTLPNTTTGSNTIGGIAFKVTLAAGQSVKIPIVLSWDIPVFQIGGNGSTGKKWYRKYTRHWTRTGQNSWAIAQDALNNYISYESQIDAWQNGVLTNPNYPSWLQTMLFNELYIYFTGGTAWESGAASGQTDNPNEDQFSHLESYIYMFYGTSDVRFYGSWALFLNWPELDKQAIRQFSDSVVTGPGAIGRAAAIGTTAHDLGGMQAGPITCTNGGTLNNYYLFDIWNCYQYRQSCQWKDLNSKLVLMIYRDFHLTGDTDMTFLNYCYNSVKTAMNMVHSQCGSDGLPQSSGVDQTYDDMGLTGTTAYCGSLFLAACQAAQAIATAMGDSAQAATYQTWYNTAQPNFESELWTGAYYKIDTGSAAPTRIMSDQLCGQWYSKALGLGGIVTDAHAQSAWQTVHDNNWSKFDAGAHGVCNVMTAAGAIDTTSTQTEETWVGTSWGVVSGMVQQSMLSQANDVGNSLYNTIWNTGQFWFRTPEAWRTGLSNIRAYYYMRGSTIWAVKRAFDLAYPAASPTNSPNYTHTITPTNTPYYSPTITSTITSTPTVNQCITSYRRINCGNVTASYTDTLGRVWVADQAFAAGGYGYVGGTGTEGNVANAIANTSDPTLYQSGRYGSGLDYRFTVANGPWRVVLKFAEIYFTTIGQRIFNVSINGTQVLTNFDVIASATPQAEFVAVDRTFDVNVAAGLIDVVFTAGSADQPKISAIEIIDLSTQCSPTVTWTPVPGTSTRTPTATPTRTYTPSATGTYTYTATPSPSATRTPTFTRTQTGTATNTASATYTTVISSPTFTTTSSGTYTRTATGTITVSPTATATISPSFTFTFTRTMTASPTATATVSPSFTFTFTRTPTPSPTASASPSFTQTRTGTPTASPSSTATCSFTPTLSPTFTRTMTYTISPTSSASPTGTQPTSTVSPTMTVSGTATRTPTATATLVSSPSFTPTVSITMTFTRTPTATNTASPTGSDTASPTSISSPSFTATQTVSLTASPSFTATRTATPSFTGTATPTFTGTITPSFTGTSTRTFTLTATFTITASPTFTVTVTSTYTISPTDSISPSATASVSPSMIVTNTDTPTITETVTGTPPTPTVTTTDSPTQTVTRTGTQTYTITRTFTPTYSCTLTDTLTLTPTPTYSATSTSTPTNTLTGTPSATATVSQTPSRTPSPTYTATMTPSLVPSVTATPTFSASRTLTVTSTLTATPSRTATPTGTASASQVPSTTASPVFTQTVTQTPIPILSATPTPAATAGKFTVENPEIFPNPYDPGSGQDMHIWFDISRNAVKITFKLYTAAFRAIKEITWTGNFGAGEITDRTVPVRELALLANGTYYYMITGVSDSGTSARSRAGVVVILK